MDDDLRDALELAMLDILDGSPAGPLFASRVKRVTTEVLARRGMRGTIEVFDGGQRVRVGLREGTVVRYVVVSVGVQ